MRNYSKLTLRLPAIVLAFTMLLGLGSCGTTRAHFGVDHDVAYNWNGGYYEDGPHHHHHHKKHHKHKHKHKKHKEYKKYKKHKKHKKHKKDHHHHHHHH